MKLRHIVIISGVVLIFLLIIMALSLGMSKEVVETEKNIYLPTLKGELITNKNEIFAVEGFGTLASYNNVDVAAEVQGKLLKGKIELKPGTKFKKGELLFSIYSIEAKLSLKARKSGFITLLANILPDVKSDFETEYNKWEAYVSRIDLDKTLPKLPDWNSDKEKVFLSSKNILSEYYGLKGLEEQLKKYAVYAPFTGTIAEVYMNENSFVNPGSRILKIIQTNNYEVAVSVPQNQIKSLSIGANAKVYSTDGHQKGLGKVVRFSDVLNTNTQSANVYVKIEPQAGESWLNGEYLKIKMDVERSHRGVRVPSSAINNNQMYVYSKADSMLTSKKVIILNDNAVGTFVSGLNDNDIVVVQEVVNHQDSAKYNVIVK